MALPALAALFLGYVNIHNVLYLFHTSLQIRILMVCKVKSAIFEKQLTYTSKVCEAVPRCVLGSAQISSKRWSPAFGIETHRT